MSIEIRQLRYAVLTADSQSFARAAAKLHVKQSTLSRRVKDLEIRFGVKLFERTARGAEVTKNGEGFIEQERRIVTDVDNLLTTARNVSYGLQGRIAVGYCSPLISGNLKLAFSDYLTRFPDVQFDGVEAGPEKLFHGLQTHTIDVAIAPAAALGSGAHCAGQIAEREEPLVIGPGKPFGRDTANARPARDIDFVATAHIAARIKNLHIQEPLSRPSTRHGEARQTLTLTFLLPPLRERPARSPEYVTAP